MPSGTVIQSLYITNKNIEKFTEAQKFSNRKQQNIEENQNKILRGITKIERESNKIDEHKNNPKLSLAVIIDGDKKGEN